MIRISVQLRKVLPKMTQFAAAGATFVVLSILPGLAPAQAADATAGKALALQWCSSCHLVAEDQPTAASVSLPSFYDMAKDTDWSEEKLATFLANPHPTMPNMSLGNIEIANLSRYISTLKR